MDLIRCMGRRRLNRLLSLVLLAVFALRTLPAWAARHTHHCTAHDNGSHAMAGMHMPPSNPAPFPVVSEQIPADGGCTHCPPAECEVTSPCATNNAAGLPTENPGPSLLEGPSAAAMSSTPRATFVAADLLTPPPRSLLSSR